MHPEAHIPLDDWMKMDNVERPLTGPVRFPYMREDVADSVCSLSDVALQGESMHHSGDLTLALHILYDDCRVLPEPAIAVPDVLRHSEIEAFESLEAVLGPLMLEYADAPDSSFTSDPRWPSVVAAAAAARKAMES